LLLLREENIPKHHTYYKQSSVRKVLYFIYSLSSSWVLFGYYKMASQRCNIQMVYNTSNFWCFVYCCNWLDFTQIWKCSYVPKAALFCEVM